MAGVVTASKNNNNKKRRTKRLRFTHKKRQRLNKARETQQVSPPETNLASSEPETPTEDNETATQFGEIEPEPRFFMMGEQVVDRDGILAATALMQLRYSYHLEETQSLKEMA